MGSDVPSTTVASLHTVGCGCRLPLQCLNPSMPHLKPKKRRWELHQRWSYTESLAYLLIHSPHDIAHKIPPPANVQPFPACGCNAFKSLPLLCFKMWALALGRHTLCGSPNGVVNRRWLRWPPSRHISPAPFIGGMERCLRSLARVALASLPVPPATSVSCVSRLAL